MASVAMTNGTPRKLALTLSGAASLGAFEAGVLTELLYALDFWHGHGGPHYQIDVLTGASAGAMTSALVARALYNYPDRANLYRAWVEDIDIQLLVKQPPVDAVLSKGVIEEIADRYLGPPSTSPRPSPMAPRVLRMYFALANMYGMPYALSFRRGGQAAQFETEFFSDGEPSTITDHTDSTTWQSIRQAAIASGNFPIAFAPAYLARDQKRFPGNLWNPFPAQFPYVDGGLFNNEPIKPMVDLALDADGGDLAPGRKFLLIDANLNKVKRWERAHPATSADVILKDVLRLLGMVRGEASALDWLQAQRRNNEIAWRDRLLTELVPMVKGNSLQDPDGFVRQLEAVAADIVSQKRTLFPDRYPPSYLEDALKRTAAAHAAALSTVGGPVRQRIYCLVVFIINSIAGLDKKAQLDIDVVYAPLEELAGRLLSSFGGFFSRAWRDHDYKLGRVHAHRVLPEILGGPAYPQEPDGDTPTRFPEYNTAPIDTAKVSMKDTDLNARKAFRDAALAKVMPLVESVRLGPGPINWIADKVIKSKVNKWLEEKLAI
jgi:predicted acylesterase/phospholipase RssA